MPVASPKQSSAVTRCWGEIANFCVGEAAPAADTVTFSRGTSTNGTSALADLQKQIAVVKSSNATPKNRPMPFLIRIPAFFIFSANRFALYLAQNYAAPPALRVHLDDFCVSRTFLTTMTQSPCLAFTNSVVSKAKSFPGPALRSPLPLHGDLMGADIKVVCYSVGTGQCSGVPLWSGLRGEIFLYWDYRADLTCLERLR